MRTPSMLAIAAILTAFGGAAVLSDPAPSPDEPLIEYWLAHPRSPLDYVVDKFADNKWVFLGEYHRIRYDVDLVRSLVPRLHEKTKVRHLAMEFLCRERTEQANRMATAEEWDRSSAIDFFREQFPGWAYEEYLDIFRVVWESNRRLAAEHGAFKLVGLHPCIDWEVVHYGTDPEAVRREKQEQQRYDEIMAEALETELLKKDLPALVFTGIAHSTAKFPEYWVGTDRPLPRMGNRVYRDPYRKEMFFIALHAPFYDSGADREIYPFDGALDRAMARYRTSIGFDVVGTPFEDLHHRESDPHSITAFRFGELFDGYVIFATPIKEYVGVGCIEDWITDEAQFRYYWRHLSNKEASERFSEIPFAEFVGDFCAPRPGQGEQFHSRFRRLPELSGLASTLALGGQPEGEAAAKESRQWMESVRAGGTIRVENPYGDVYARFGGYEDQVEILATLQHLDPGARLEVDREEVDSGLRVWVHPSGGGTDGPAESRNRVDLVLFVPQGARIDVETREGKIEAKGLRSDLVASSISGDIRIRGIEGHVQAKSARGRLSATLETAVTDRGQALTTETGEIEVHLWEGADLDVSVATSGEITTDYSIQIEHRRHEEPGKHATATVGSGGPGLTLRSRRGDIRLLRLQK